MNQKKENAGDAVCPCCRCESEKCQCGKDCRCGCGAGDKACETPMGKPEKAS